MHTRQTAQAHREIRHTVPHELEQHAQGTPQQSCFIDISAQESRTQDAKSCSAQRYRQVLLCAGVALRIGHNN
jgi:hypothetical protein